MEIRAGNKQGVPVTTRIATERPERIVDGHADVTASGRHPSVGYAKVSAVERPDLGVNIRTRRRHERSRQPAKRTERPRSQPSDDTGDCNRFGDREADLRVGADHAA